MRVKGENWGDFNVSCPDSLAVEFLIVAQKTLDRLQVRALFCPFVFCKSIFLVFNNPVNTKKEDANDW